MLPTDPAARKSIPVTTGVLDYFPAALAEVAKVSKAGNDQHNPGEPLHWARGKSMDQADTLVRHLMERGGIDVDGMRHSAKLAWRALALLQIELEEAGEAPVARGAQPVVAAPAGTFRAHATAPGRIIEIRAGTTRCPDSNCRVPGEHDGEHVYP